MEKLRILIMDDEIYAGNYNPSIQAEEKLSSLGHFVETTDKMSVVLSSIKNRYYDVYVLDVDMSFVKDEIEDASGTTIGRILRERNSFYNIVVFSARGGAEDWFAAANYHFQGYIYKAEEGSGVDQLAEHISALAKSKKGFTVSLEKPQYQNTALIYYHSETPAEKISLANIKNIIDELLPGAQIEVCDKLEVMKTKIKNKPAVALMFHAMFKNLEKSIKDVREICEVQPLPHVIICVDSSHDCGAGANRSAILNLVNARPFKMIDLNQPASEETIKISIKSALEWYGKDEIFEYPEDYKEFYGYPLTEQDLDVIKGADDYYDSIEFPDEGERDEQ